MFSGVVSISSRKGFAISTETTVYLILLLAGILILFPFALKAGEKLKSNSDNEACKYSVLWKERLKIANEPITDIPLKCPANYEIIKDDQKIKEELANKMYDCWYKFNEGKSDFLDERDFTGETYCYMCSEIDFDESLKDKKLEGFGDYILEKTIPGSDKTYAQYFFPRDPIESVKTLNDLPLDKPYYITFQIYRRGVFNVPILRPTSEEPKVSSDIKQSVEAYLGYGTSGTIGCIAGGIGGVITNLFLVPESWGISLAALPAFAKGGCILGAAAADFIYISYGVLTADVKHRSSIWLSNSQELMGKCKK